MSRKTEKDEGDTDGQDNNNGIQYERRNEGERRVLKAA